MAMNREQRRYLQKQGQLDAEGNPVAERREPRQAATKSERVGPGQYVSEVRGELNRVSWPTRSEVINYTIVVMATVVILTAFIAALDYGFGEAVLALLGLSDG